jgi:hypothetical protein
MVLCPAPEIRLAPCLVDETARLERFRQLSFKNPVKAFWLGAGYLTAKEIYPVNLLVHWEVGEKEPWCLATNLPDREMTCAFMLAECGLKRCLVI